MAQDGRTGISQCSRESGHTPNSPSSRLKTTARRNQKRSLMFSVLRMRFTPWPPLIPACGSYSTLGSHSCWFPALSHLLPGSDGSWQSLLLCDLKGAWYNFASLLPSSVEQGCPNHQAQGSRERPCAGWTLSAGPPHPGAARRAWHKQVALPTPHRCEWNQGQVKLRCLSRSLCVEHGGGDFEFPHQLNQDSVLSCPVPSRTKKLRRSMAIHMVLGTRGECYLSRDGTGMAPRKLSPVVYVQWQAGAESKDFGVKKVPGGVRDTSNR